MIVALVVALVVSLVAAASLSAAVPAERPANCPNDYGVRRAAGAGPHRLDRLPGADLVLTVYREVDRCPAPLIVRHDVRDAGRDR